MRCLHIWVCEAGGRILDVEFRYKIQAAHMHMGITSRQMLFSAPGHRERQSAQVGNGCRSSAPSCPLFRGQVEEQEPAKKMEKEQPEKQEENRERAVP